MGSARTPHGVVVHLSSPYLIWRSEKWQRGGRGGAVDWFWLVGSGRAGMDWAGLVTPTPSRHVCHPDGEMEMKKRAQIGLAAAEAG